MTRGPGSFVGNNLDKPVRRRSEKLPLMSANVRPPAASVDRHDSVKVVNIEMAEPHQVLTHYHSCCHHIISTSL